MMIKILALMIGLVILARGPPALADCVGPLTVARTVMTFAPDIKEHTIRGNAVKTFLAALSVKPPIQADLIMIFTARVQKPYALLVFFRGGCMSEHGLMSLKGLRKIIGTEA